MERAWLRSCASSCACDADDDSDSCSAWRKSLSSCSWAALSANATACALSSRHAADSATEIAVSRPKFRFQFSMRQLLSAMTVAAVMLALVHLLGASQAATLARLFVAAALVCVLSSPALPANFDATAINNAEFRAKPPAEDKADAVIVTVQVLLDRAR